MSRVAAMEWGRYGIRVNVICPLASSPGLDGWSGDLPDAAEQLVGTIPLGWLGDAEQDIGRAVVLRVQHNRRNLYLQAFACDMPNRRMNSIVVWRTPQRSMASPIKGDAAAPRKA